MEVLALTINLYLTQLQELAEKQRQEAVHINTLLANDSFALSLDPKKSLSPPKAKTTVPHFNFSPLMNSLGELNRISATLDQKLATTKADKKQIIEINRRLFLSERELTLDKGLPGRKWYKHQIYAPGFYTGYGVKTLPRIRESIEAEMYDQVDKEITITSAVIEGLVEYLSEIEAML